MKNAKLKGFLPILIFALCVFIFLFCRFGLNVLKKQIQPGDFLTAYTTWEVFLQGGNIYNYPSQEGVVFKYAPFFAIFFSPLALLTLQHAFAVWYFINTFFFTVGLALFYFLKHRKIKAAHFIVFSLLGVIFIFRSLMPEIKIGNTNLLVLGLFFLFLFFYLRNNIALSAFIFAFLAYIKMGPLIILLYFIRKRQFRFILWFGFFTLILVILPPFLLNFSWQRAFLVFKDWHHNLLMPLPQDITQLQSLKFMLTRYLSNTDWLDVNFLSLPDNLVLLVYRITSAALILGALFYKTPLRQNAGNGNLSRELALIDINMLFILSVILSPACSYQNFVYLLAPLLVLFLIGWGYRKDYPKFFWFSLAVMIGLNIFTRNAVWKLIGVTSVKGRFPFLAYTVWPIISLALYLLLYSLRSRVIKAKADLTAPGA